MIYNVCRPITLYNDFLPPDNHPHTDWDYLAFGYFDGLKIGEKNLFIDGKCSMECIWDYDMERMKMLQGTYSEQTIYGFRTKDDTDFWMDAKNEKMEYPFLFIVLMQDKADKNLARIDNRINIENRLSDNGERKVITYLTLDNCSMLMLFLCKTYESGSGLIDSFHRGRGQDILKELGIRLSYSYTVAAVQKQFVESDDVQKLKDLKMKHAYIYGIERYPNSIKTVYEKMCERLRESNVSLIRKESVLGCNDEVIVLENISWSDFLALYRDKTGILNHSSTEYGACLIGVTTIITEIQNDGITDKKEQPREEEEQENLKEGNYVDSQRKTGDFSQSTLLQNMRTRIKENSGGSPNMESPYLERYLYQVINALQKFERPTILDYVFHSMFLPIDMVLDIVGHYEKNTGKDLTGNFYEFVKGLNLCIQNSVRSDRQFTQSLDFNIQIYNTPVRLNAFYNAFIYAMKNFLQYFDKNPSNGHRYEFLASMGVTNKIQVNELFKNLSDSNRLFLVSIPENQAYDMKSMLFVLSHEVAHFVGAAVRNREYRYECAIKITARMTSMYFLLKLKEKYKDANERFACEEDWRYWNRFERLLEKYLTEYLKNLKNPDYLKSIKQRDRDESEISEICKLYEKYQKYTHVLREMLVDAVSDILRDKRKELFGYLQEKEYLCSLNNPESDPEEKRKNMIMRIGEVSKELTGYSIWETTTHLSLVKAVNRMIVLFKECEADLVDILTLKLSLKDYLWAIKKSILEQGREKKIYYTEIIIRSGLVSCCLFDEDKRLGYGWTDRQLKEVRDLDDPVLNKMEENILKFKNHFFSENHVEKTGPEGLSETMDIFLNTAILEPFLSYLLKCRETFELKLHTEERSEDEKIAMEKMQQELQAMYDLCREENIEELIWKMQSYIEQYKILLDVEIDEILKKRINGNR